MERDRAYKQIEERIKLFDTFMRFTFNAFLITIAGTVTIWANRTISEYRPFIIVGLFASVFLLTLLFWLAYMRNEEIKKF